MLKEKEGASDKKANETVEEIWTIINDAAQYMFCSAHSVSMAYDSLYVAWLKVHYPYELYVTMLKLYDEKKNTEKISAIISEMKRYKGIKLLAGKWGQDNRDWLVDKQNQTISQSISSIRYMSKQVAEDLYSLSQQTEAEIGVEYVLPKLNSEGRAQKRLLMQLLKETSNNKQLEDISRQLNELTNKPEYLEVQAQEIHHTAKLDSFTNVLRALQMNTCLDTRQIKILIELGYFEEFGGSRKLMRIYNEFFEGENKLTKSIKSFIQRLATVREFEDSILDEDLPLQEKLRSEQENIGLCLTVDPQCSGNTYFVRAVDEKWGTTVTLYSISNGKSGNVRFRKADLQKKPVAPNQVIKILEGNRSPRYTFKGGKKAVIPGENEYWVKAYSIVKPA